MATNGPFEPSMIFRSRTTKQLSNVIEQNALRRSPGSSMSLMRTSVISTVVLLAQSRDLLTTASSVDKPKLTRPETCGHASRLLGVTANTKVGRSAAGKLMPQAAELVENFAYLFDPRRQRAGRNLEAISHKSPEIRG